MNKKNKNSKLTFKTVFAVVFQLKRYILLRKQSYYKANKCQLKRITQIA